MDVLGSKLDRLQVGQDKLLHSQDEDVFKNFCSRISNLSPSSELEALLRACQGSQPDWILENPAFEEWIMDTSSRVLWAKGNPGAGKSVLAAVVAEHLREAARDSSMDASTTGVRISSTKTSVAAFFYKYQEKVTAETMLRCIARQLLEQGGAELWLVKEVRNAASLNSGRFDVVTLLRDLLSHFDQTFLIIDALDECDGCNQDDTVDVLKSLLEDSPSLYVMITLRADMEKYFSGKGSMCQAKRVDMVARDENVLAYVKGKMEQAANRRDTALCEVNEKDRDQIGCKVVEHTEGVFLVAVRHMHTLGDCEDQYSLEKAVSSLSSDLGKTYDEAVRRIEAQNERKRKIGRRALLWVVNMREPLRMKQLKQALATYDSEGDLDERRLSQESVVLVATKGLITKNQESGLLSVHKSLSDYFKPTEKKLEVFGCDPDIEMASISLKYLSFSRFARGIVGVWETLNGAHQLALHRRVCDNPFSLYAAQCWGWHAGGDNELYLKDEILTFFNSGGHLQSAIEIWGCVDPRVNSFRHSRSSHEFASIDLASYFNLSRRH